MRIFLENTFQILNYQNNQIIIMAVYIALILLTLMLRVIAHLHFRGANLALQLDTRKEIENKSDITKLKNKLLRRAVAEYIRTAERAVTTVPTSQIVERTVSNMTFLGWRYDSVVPFVESMETGLLWVGAILTITFSNYAFMYGSLAVIAFVLTRLFTAFFNAKSAKSQLIDDLILYVEREIGRFFATDTGGAVIRLKNDLSEIINKQTIVYKETMENIGHIVASAMTNVTESMTTATSSIGPDVAAAMDEKLLNMNDTLTKTLQDWQNALTKATDVQIAMNDSSERISRASTRLQSASDLLSTHMQGHSNALSEQMIALVNAVNHFAIQQETVIQQVKYIERNQHSLEASLHSYEDSLQNLTKSVGEGLGAFINLHAQTSAQVVNDALKTNIDKVTNILDAANKGG